ncbi:MAG: histidine phosphatase family protein [Pseudomonas sp.]|uniref:histidine phosphatase family protein n=1 Tax=Ectopseudomonas mendocina TaxID=300 RepID=UPI0031331E2D
MPLYLVRHSRVAASGLCYGQSDVPLAASFADEAAALKRQLVQTFGAQLPPVLCSPSARCVQLAQALDMRVNLDARLMELNFGAWEGKSWAELDGPEARHWGDHWQTVAPPHGESLAELISRVDECIAGLPAGDHLLITHAGPIRVLWHQFSGLTLEQAFACPVPHAKLIVL